MFAVIYAPYSLRFWVKANTHEEACEVLKRILGKAHLPWHVRITQI